MIKIQYAPLPPSLSVGQRIVQTKYAPNQVLTVFKVDNGQVLLMTEDGYRKFHEPLSIQMLRDYDYQLITEGTPT